MQCVRAGQLNFDNLVILKIRQTEKLVKKI